MEAEKNIEALLSDVKNYLDITWEDSEGDKKLSGILLRGMAYLDRIGGDGLDYEAEGKARELLFEYVRYARNNVLSDFQDNYLHELLALQIDMEVERHTGTSNI